MLARRKARQIRKADLEATIAKAAKKGTAPDASVVTELASVERQIDELTGAMGRLRTQMALDDPVNMEQKLAALRQALDDLPPVHRAWLTIGAEHPTIPGRADADLQGGDGRRSAGGSRQGRVRGLPRPIGAGELALVDKNLEHLVYLVEPGDFAKSGSRAGTRTAL